MTLCPLSLSYDSNPRKGNCMYMYLLANEDEYYHITNRLKQRLFQSLSNNFSSIHTIINRLF